MCIWPCLRLPLMPNTACAVACARTSKGGDYLFNHKALVYLGRYLYRGVIQERDIVRCAQGQVTLRYRDSGTGKNTLRTVSGADFLQLVLQHVLPKGFRRSRNFGLAHPNCKHHQRLALLAHGAQAQRRVGLHDALHAGHAACIDAAAIERTPKIAVPVLRLCSAQK